MYPHLKISSSGLARRKQALVLRGKQFEVGQGVAKQTFRLFLIPQF